MGCGRKAMNAFALPIVFLRRRRVAIAPPRLAQLAENHIRHWNEMNMSAGTKNLYIHTDIECPAICIRVPRFCIIVSATTSIFQPKHRGSFYH